MSLCSLFSPASNSFLPCPTINNFISKILQNLDYQQQDKFQILELFTDLIKKPISLESLPKLLQVLLSVSLSLAAFFSPPPRSDQFPEIGSYAAAGCTVTHFPWKKKEKIHEQKRNSLSGDSFKNPCSLCCISSLFYCARKQSTTTTTTTSTERRVRERHSRVSCTRSWESVKGAIASLAGILKPQFWGAKKIAKKATLIPKFGETSLSLFFFPIQESPNFSQNFFLRGGEGRVWRQFCVSWLLF